MREGNPESWLLSEVQQPVTTGQTELSKGVAMKQKDRSPVVNRLFGLIDCLTARIVDPMFRIA